MKALSFSTTGNPETVLGIMEKDIPTPGDHEVLVKVLASPVHPADFLFMEGNYRYKPAFPQTAGLEGGGIVMETGKNVPPMKGKLVSFITLGVWAEYVVVPEESLIILPDDFPIGKAAQFFLNPFTAWGLLEESKLKAGEWLLLTAANSSVSRIVIQLAKLRGLKILAVVRDLKQSESLTALGADAVVLSDDEYFFDEISNINTGTGVQAAFDAVGGTMGTKILQNLAANGRLIIYGLLSKDPVQFHNAQVIYKNLHINSFGIRGFLQGQSKEKRDEMILTLIEVIANPAFELPVKESFTLEQFKEAFGTDKQTDTIGKIMFRING